jgi:hypothetical protein
VRERELPRRRCAEARRTSAVRRRVHRLSLAAQGRRERTRVRERVHDMPRKGSRSRRRRACNK